MKAFRTLFRSIRDAIRSVGRNFSLSLASISCIMVTLIIIGIVLLMSLNVRNFATEIEKDVTIVVFMDSNVTEIDRELFEISLKQLENIETYTFLSKQEVKMDLEKSNDTLGGILKGWTEEDNPLKDTYQVKVGEVLDISKTAKAIEALPGVSAVNYGEGLAEKLIGVFTAIEKITLIAALGLVVVTVFLIINTIKLTIYSRRREISIMRLVGASNNRIKLPFVIEGVILGIIGSIVPVLIVIYGYSSLYDYFNGVLFTPIFKMMVPVPIIFYVSASVLFLGMIVGMIGSARATRRFIKG